MGCTFEQGERYMSTGTVFNIGQVVQIANTARYGALPSDSYGIVEAIHAPIIGGSGVRCCAVSVFDKDRNYLFMGVFPGPSLLTSKVTLSPRLPER
jgi:hypothetical protein